LSDKLIGINSLTGKGFPVLDASTSHSKVVKYASGCCRMHKERKETQEEREEDGRKSNLEGNALPVTLRGWSRELRSVPHASYLTLCTVNCEETVATSRQRGEGMDGNR
jgi:hypothetical protein